jgi:hypothetical protein
MQVTITKDNERALWTYDAVQVFRIQHVDADSIKVKDINSSVPTRARMSITRLEELFACGRAEWGDRLGDINQIIVRSGGRMAWDRQCAEL